MTHTIWTLAWFATVGLGAYLMDSAMHSYGFGVVIRVLLALTGASVLALAIVLDVRGQRESNSRKERAKR